MQLTFSPQDEAFRQNVRDFLADKLSADLKRYASRMTSVYADKETALEWQAILHAQGWAAPSWPIEYGGCDWSIAQYYIFDAEMARAGAPPLSPMGLGMCGPALIGHGSKQQQDYYLPRIIEGTD
jgi:alkylation response protein AidB-like acyl-CoA dehydrogenase